MKGLRRTGRIFGGVFDDYQRRARHCLSDYTDGWHSKTISAAIFMFFATFSSTVALGELARRQTNGHIGVTEYLLLQSGAGLLHALFSSQPLLILRPTGPITVFVVELYTLSQKFGIDFFAWLAWVGIWVGVYMVIISAFDGSHYISYLTRFLHDLYSMFVCTIYIEDGISGMVARFSTPIATHTLNPAATPFADALFSLTLSVIVISVAMWLYGFMTSNLLFQSARKLVRQNVVDYALVIGVAVAIGVSYAPSAGQVNVDRIALPATFGCATGLLLESATGPTFNSTESAYVPRMWWTHLDPQPSWIIGAAALAAIPIVCLFFIDQNISALLTQVPSMKTVKGSYYHNSFFLVGLFNGLLPCLGLPFVTASLPHSPQFARSLSDLNPETGRPEKVHENRIAPIILYAICGAALFVPSVLTVIPEGVVDGILTFVGLTGLLHGNQLVERLLLLVTDPRQYPKNRSYSQVPARRMHLYTIIQAICLGCCWAIKQTPAGLAFPVFIVLLVPLRTRLLPKIFSEVELAALDSSELQGDPEELVALFAENGSNDEEAEA